VEREDSHIPNWKTLGMYKTIIKIFEGHYTRNNKQERLTDKKSMDKDAIMRATAKTALEIQHKLLNLDIKHCYTYLY
jgi:hypothetical protein